MTQPQRHQRNPLIPGDPAELVRCFAVVQLYLEELAGGEELMLYYFPAQPDTSHWCIEFINPCSLVLLGEVSGKFTVVRETLPGAVSALKNAIANNDRNNDDDL